MDKEPTRYPISIKVEGKTYRGRYWIAGKILVVSTMKGGKSKQLGSNSGETLAKQLLQDLAKEGKA